MPLTRRPEAAMPLTRRPPAAMPLTRRPEAAPGNDAESFTRPAAGG